MKIVLDIRVPLNPDFKIKINSNSNMASPLIIRNDQLQGLANNWPCCLDDINFSLKSKWKKKTLCNKNYRRTKHTICYHLIIN